jgi:hypothetical protein
MWKLFIISGDELYFLTDIWRKESSFTSLTNLTSQQTLFFFFFLLRFKYYLFILFFFNHPKSTITNNYLFKYQILNRFLPLLSSSFAPPQPTQTLKSNKSANPKNQSTPKPSNPRKVPKSKTSKPPNLSQESRSLRRRQR